MEDNNLINGKSLRPNWRLSGKLLGFAVLLSQSVPALSAPATTLNASESLGTDQTISLPNSSTAFTGLKLPDSTFAKLTSRLIVPTELSKWDKAGASDLLSRLVNITLPERFLPLQGNKLTLPFYADQWNSETDYVLLGDDEGHFLSVDPSEINVDKKLVTIAIEPEDVELIQAMKSLETSFDQALAATNGPLDQNSTSVPASIQPLRTLRAFAVRTLLNDTDLTPQNDLPFGALVRYDDAGSLQVDPKTHWKTSSVSEDWNGQHIALVIHGIRNDITNMTEFANYLSSVKDSAGHLVYSQVWGFNYNWKEHISLNGNRLATLIHERLKNSSTRIDVYGHSTGGLVARWALEKAPLSDSASLGCGSHVARLFTFGTPHSGVPREKFRCALSVIPAKLVEKFLQLSQPGVDDLLEPNAFLRELNDNSQPASRDNIAYYTASGNNYSSYLSFNDLAGFTIPLLPQKYNTVGKVVKHVYGTSVELDGIVPVASAEGSNLDRKAAQWRHFPVSYYLNHGEMRGEYQSNIFDLDAGYIHPHVLDSILAASFN